MESARNNDNSWLGIISYASSPDVVRDLRHCRSSSGMVIVRSVVHRQDVLQHHGKTARLADPVRIEMALGNK